MAAILAGAQATLERDAQLLLDSVEGLLQSAQLGELRTGQDRLQMKIHASRLVRCDGAASPAQPLTAPAQLEAAQALSRLAELLRRNTLLSDYAGRAAASDAGAAAAEAQRAEGVAELSRRTQALLGRLNAQAEAGEQRHVLLQVGEESVAEADDVLDDASGVTERLYSVAR
jgi:hypothetical protein